MTTFRQSCDNHYGIEGAGGNKDITDTTHRVGCDDRERRIKGRKGDKPFYFSEEWVLR
jgi:hypothetical protein